MNSNKNKSKTKIVKNPVKNKIVLENVKNKLATLKLKYTSIKEKNK